ncbi:MAG: AsmA family protein [Xanthobacteraceae bacterium]
MQTTLLGLAIAVILALVTALVGPLFVDWGRYRATFETEATELLGAPVRISGPIEARLLPTPSLSLHSVELAAGEASFSARALRFELALGPLLRGEWRVNELTLDEPLVRLVLNAGGQLRAPGVGAAVAPDRLSIDRLSIERGHVDLVDAASGSALAVDDLSFAGDVRSLVGPLRGGGTFVSDGASYRYRIASGRGGADGAKLRLSLEARDRPLIAEADGVLRIDAASPRYEGALTLMRPAGAALSDGRTLAREPWRLTTQLRADPRRVRAEDIEFQYGPDEHSLRLSGKADIALGASPHFAASLAGRQLDLDRAAGAPDAGRGSPAATLLAAVRMLFEEARPPMRGKLDLDVDALTMGGASLQNLHGAIGVARDYWDIETLEFRAPGFTQVHLSGRLESSAAKGLEFAGPARIESSDPKALWSFIEGENDPLSAAVASLRASGDLTLGDRGVILDRLQAEIDHKPIEGRIAYAPAGKDGPARLDATLRAEEIDLDRTIAVANSAFAGVKVERPRNIALALAIGKVSYADVQASKIDAKLKLDASGLTLERFSIGDFRGASVKATGVIDVASSPPHGAMSLALNAARADGLIALAGRFAPHAAADLKRYGSQLGPAELRARLEVRPAAATSPVGQGSPGAGTLAKLAVDGKLGATRLNFLASGNGALATLASAKIKIDGSLESDDGKVLAALVGLDRVAAVDSRPASIMLSGQGPLDGDMGYEFRLTSGGLWASGEGSARLEMGTPKGVARLSLTASDARALMNAAAPAAMGLAIESKLAFFGRALTFEDVKARIAGATVGGQLSLNLTSPTVVDGRISATDVDAAPVLAALIGVPKRPAPDQGAGFPAEPFARPLFDDVKGSVSFEAERATLLPGLAAQTLKGRARFAGASFDLADVTGTLAGGALTADAAFSLVPGGLSVRGRLDLSKGDLARITFGRSKAPASGGVLLSLELAGTGLSPAALVGALQGKGTLTLDRAQFDGLDPKAIDAAIRASERGLAPERLPGYLAPALDAGRLTVTSATGALAILDGRVRLAPVTVAADGADVAFAGTLNLVDSGVDLRFTLSGAPREEMKGRRPEISVVLNGPISSPKREVDTSELVNFVTLRAVERETKRVEAAEREAKKRAEAAAALERAERERIERERATQRVGPDGAQPKPGDPSMGADRTGPAVSERAPDLPPAIEVKPQSAKPARRPSAAAKQAPAPESPTPPPPPPRRSLWDDFFRRQ